MDDGGMVLTPDDVSRRLGISKSALAKWRVFGQGPAFIKIGRKVGYRAGTVDAWLHANERHSTSQTHEKAPAGRHA